MNNTQFILMLYLPFLRESERNLKESKNEIRGISSQNVVNEDIKGERKIYSRKLDEEEDEKKFYFILMHTIFISLVYFFLFLSFSLSLSPRSKMINVE